MDWFALISLVLNLVLGGGFIVTMVTLRSKRRKEAAEAGKTEIDLRIAEANIDKMLDEANKEQMMQLITELREFRRKVKELLAEKTDLEIRVLQLTRDKLIAETKLKQSRCDVLNCPSRIPPQNENTD